jgi:mono/diheme cytochrome c family protein
MNLGITSVQLQTPSLAGGVTATEPLTWEGDVATIAAEANETSQQRMGGHQLTNEDLADITAYVDSTRLPIVPAQDPALGEEGKALFEREDVACSTCHSGPRFTDNRNHVVLGETATQTPSLSGIAASAPYLHDGSAPNLRAVLAFAAEGTMGDTSTLSTHELDALEAYLRSL